MPRSFLLFTALVALVAILFTSSINAAIPHHVVTIGDVADFKKLLKSKINVLVLTASSDAAAASIMPLYQDASRALLGKGTFGYVNCQVNRRTCKHIKSDPETYELKHFKEGSFNKDYERPLTLKSLKSFMENPDADAPWEEDPTAQNVIHANDKTLPKVIAQKKKTMVMFYAPWCGHCKSMKPDYAEVATELKKEALLVAVNADAPESSSARNTYNVTGFPTLIFFDKGEQVLRYDGGRTKDGLIKFLRDPYNPDAAKSETKEDEQSWADTPSYVVHLTDSTFDTFMEMNPSVMVMFYAPWCGHCKSMKPEFVIAAEQMHDEGKVGKLAAVDCTKERKIGERFDVKGYPTVKYFEDGKVKYTYEGDRKAPAIVTYMDNPTPPPPPPPPEVPWSEKPSNVVHLTGETFMDVLKRKKHALVMFYAPWCGHCKNAKPFYEEASAELAENKRVAFAAIDCTLDANKAVCEANDVKGYPTIKVYSYGKFTRLFTDERTKDGFANFFKQDEF